MAVSCFRSLPAGIFVNVDVRFLVRTQGGKGKRGPPPAGTHSPLWCRFLRGLTRCGCVLGPPAGTHTTTAA